MKTKTLLLLVNKIIANDLTKPDRHYLFNLICLFAILCAFLATIVNYWAEVGKYAVLSSLLLTVAYLSLYLVTRSSKKFHIWMPILFLVITYPVLIGLWFFNAGHEGTIGYIFLIYVLGIVCIFPKAYHFPLVVLNIIVFCLLLLAEYIHPEWITPYEDSRSMIIDYGMTFAFISLFMTIILRTLVRGYDIEKNNVLQEKSLAERNSEIIARQNQELQNINILKDRLFATISHDLRSPINSLKGTLSLLHNQSLSEDELRKLTLNISDRLYHTSSLLENLLSWSNSQLGGTRIKAKKVKMASIVEICIGLYANQAQQKHISILNQVKPNHYSYVDEDMLHSIIRNLLSNSIKFTPNGGEISLRSWMDGDKAFLEIKDSGVGMDQHQLDRLFGAMHSSSEGTASEKGIGLGLLICKDFVEKNNGQIQVQSKPDEGTIFTVSLLAYDGQTIA